MNFHYSPKNPIISQRWTPPRILLLKETTNNVDIKVRSLVSNGAATSDDVVVVRCLLLVIVVDLC